MFCWTEELATGVEKIDDQHKMLFEKANAILAIDEEGSVEQVRVAMDFLTHYVVDHFSYEEYYMIKSHYPDFEQHREEHTYFILEIYKLHKTIAEKGINEYVVQSLKVLILEWLVNHINENDKKCVVHLNEVGA